MFGRLQFKTRCNYFKFCMTIEDTCSKDVKGKLPLELLIATLQLENFVLVLFMANRGL